MNKYKIEIEAETRGRNDGKYIEHMIVKAVVHETAMQISEGSVQGRIKLSVGKGKWEMKEVQDE